MQKSKDKYWKKMMKSMRLNMLLLLVFASLILFSTALIRRKLLMNAQEMGTYLAWNYSAEEQNNITVYKTLIELGTQDIDEQIARGTTPEQLQVWVYDLFDNIGKMLGNQAVDLYAVVDNRIIAANPWEGDSEYEFTATEWYQEAMESNGEVIFTDVYQDAVTGKPVITVAKKALQSDSVLIFDIALENFHTYQSTQDLPKGSSYYLCDQSGNLLYYKTTSNGSVEQVQEYISDTFGKISSGQLRDYDDTVVDLNGEKQGVYYCTMSNGWTSILTIPMSTILKELTSFSLTLFFVFFILLLILLYMAMRDYRLNLQMKRVNDTVQVLGNSYYAIYRIDYMQGSYEAIKISEDVQDRIPYSGNYEILLAAIQTLVDPSTYEEFAESFSIQNIRRLVSEKIRDFGGEYLRYFDSIPKWVSIRVLFDEVLDPEAAVLCFRIVDQEKKQQLEHLRLLESALEAAQNSEKARGAFFSNMSHDMRTPLNAIIGLSALVRENLQDTEKAKNYMQKIEASAQQLLRLINGILEISKLEHGVLVINNSEMDLVQCVEDCTAFFKELAKKEKKDFQITMDLKHTLVMGDSLRIVQILNNLLSNAFKYSDAGAKIRLKLLETEYSQHSEYQIYVQDSGSGMTQEFLGQIFESYTRETRFGAKNVNGTGLGMPIVKRLVKQMGGEIAVQSQLGIGTSFLVKLPMQTISQPVILPEQPEQADAGSSVSLEGCKVLLAEDNEINMEIFTDMFAVQGIVLTAVWNGEEAVQAFAESAPGTYDIVLLDMLMPKLSGVEAAKRIRALERPDAKEVPMIAITANAFAEDIAMTAEAGMNAHIAKPVDFPLLFETMKKLSQHSGK